MIRMVPSKHDGTQHSAFVVSIASNARAMVHRDHGKAAAKRRSMSQSSRNSATHMRLWHAAQGLIRLCP
jgi:hypothetical protein